MGIIKQNNNMTNREEQINDGLQSGEFIINKGIVVCSTCLGNCGQCGNTGLLGNPPANFDALVMSIHGYKFVNKKSEIKPKLWYDRIKSFLLG